MHKHPKTSKLFNAETSGCNNELYSRLEAILDLPGKAFLYRPPCTVHRSLEIICVAVACYANRFLNVRPQAEVEEIQIW